MTGEGFALLSRTGGAEFGGLADLNDRESAATRLGLGLVLGSRDVERELHKGGGMRHGDQRWPEQ
jgi:hypothetical protein